MQAMLQLDKIDIARLEKARNTKNDEAERNER
jgi:hypothetical protein